MKLKHSVAAAVIGALFLMSASGCDFTDFSTESILRPPKTMGDDAEIEQLIADTAKGAYTLKYPKNGNYRSAIIMTDLDGDNVDEAVAFYRKKSDVTGIHMLVMYENEGKWMLSSDFVTETTDVDSVDFADIDGDKNLEILVGYSTYTINESFLSCCSYSNGETETINAGQRYSSFYCGDLNGDGKYEVIALSLYSTENEAKATMLEYSETGNSLYVKATVPMDPNVTKYKSVAVCDLNQSVKGLLVDGSFANEDINTQIIYYNNDLTLLRNPLYKEKTKNATQRSVPVVCSDINNDLIYEIPIISSLPQPAENESINSGIKITWNTFDENGEKLVPNVNMIADQSLKYTIKMPESWLGNTVTAVCVPDNNTTEFYEWDGDFGDKLFEIKMFDVSEWDMGKSNDEYTLIYKDNKYAYTFINSDSDSNYAMTDDEIKTAFSLLDEIVV